MSLNLASRAGLLSESLPLKIAARAKKMIAEGIDVVNMTVGEPDFPTPASIKEAGVHAIESDFTRYTPASGIADLRQAVALKLKNENNLDYAPEQVIITNGAKQALASTLLALVEPGEEVIYPVPSYASYRDLILLAGGVPVVLETRMEDGFKINEDELRKLVTPRTKAIIINSPNNPTGAVFTREETIKLGKVLAELDIWVISDEIYEKLRYDGLENLSFAEVPDLYEKTATINGVSKYFAMTGWRIGYLAAPLELAKAVGKIQSQVTGSPVSISQKAALEAYVGNAPEPDEMVKEFARRKDLIVELLQQVPGTSTPEPQGAFYAFTEVSTYYGKKAGDKIIDNSFDLCSYLLDEHHLSIIPGSAFGNDNFVRFSFAASEDSIREAVKRFAQGLQELQD